MTEQIRVLIIAASVAILMAGCGSMSDEMMSLPRYSEDAMEPDAYRNFLEVENEWPNYNIGDPYLLKFNGLYYLYASTPYGVTGVRCWSSPDLVNWSFRGLVTEDPATFTAYSPKVKYSNGVFYLYTTPNGNGLHILTADNPLGPFTDVTGRIHDCIDACIFVDDDGTWYLGHAAATEGIEYHRMTDPLTIGSETYRPGTVIAGNGGNAWTETGEIFKKGDRYFMTFSGNHVVSDSYRTNWAVSRDPVSGYRMGEVPLLTNTEGRLVGTGCGLLFSGPDLVTDYIVYHNLVNPKVGPIRRLNIDRVAFAGDRLIAYGPTDFAQQVPWLPDFASNSGEVQPFDRSLEWTDGWARASEDALLLTSAGTKDRYAAEWNVNPESSRVTIYFAYRDEDNHGSVSLSPDGTATLSWVQGGIGGEEATCLLSPYQADSPHAVRVVQEADQIHVYLDSMRKFSLPLSLGGGRLGVRFSNGGLVGFTAFTNHRDGADGAYYKPVSGEIPADSFARDSYRISGKTESDLPEKDIVWTTGPELERCVSLDKGDYVWYRINTGDVGSHAMTIRYQASREVRVALADAQSKVLMRVTLPPTRGQYEDFVCQDVPLSKGFQTVAFVVVAENLTLRGLSFTPSSVIPAPIEPVGLGEGGFTVMDGKWLPIGASLAGYDSVSQANLVFGDRTWADYTMRGTIRINSRSGKAGFLVRVRNIATNNNDLQIFAHNDQGYYAYLDADGYVGLDKHQYNSTNLVEKRMPIGIGQDYTWEVRVRGNTITAMLDGKVAFAWTDTSYPHATGKVGLHNESCEAVYSRISIRGN